MLELTIFSVFAAVAVISAILVVTLRNTVHSALFLGLCLAAVAGLFSTLGADFLFAAQIMIYVGGIAVLITFAVMLLGRASDLHLRQINNMWGAALLVAGITGLGLWRVVSHYANVKAPAAPTAATTKPLGLLLMGHYAVPFELISLVLTAALLGAIYFSKKEERQ